MMTRILFTKPQAMLLSPSRRLLSTLPASVGASVMHAEGYRAHSHTHYNTHNFSRDMLIAATTRVLASIDKCRPFRLVDLGPADGTNSMNTIKFLVDSMPEPKPASMHLTFEEHPDTDEQVLRDVLNSHKDWFLERNIDYDILMKSFYQPLFKEDSIDLFISYICLHWLDTTDATGSISTWKRFGGNTKTQFIFAQEEGVPTSVVDQWKKGLATPHLAKFFALRARELRLGGEMALVMVGTPFAWCMPCQGGASLLTQAVQECVERGMVRPDVLENTIVPYYLRSLDELEEALGLSNKKSTDRQLDLVETRTIQLNLGKGDDASMDGAFQMLWSVHQGALRAGGATNDEMDHIQKQAKILSQKLFSSSAGVETNYLACTIRRSR
jgi:SAM dependent carboxyl methyltransferase